MKFKLPVLVVTPAALLGVLSAALSAQPQTQPVPMAGAAAGLPRLPAVVRDEPAQRTEARLKWFREARFGIFIHWGVYAVPARGEWYMNNGKVSVATYRAFAKDFTAAKYDPQAWAQLFADAGEIHGHHHQAPRRFRLVRFRRLPTGTLSRPRAPNAI